MQNAGWVFTPEECRLMLRCGDPHCPQSSCTEGEFVNLCVYINSPAVITILICDAYHTYNVDQEWGQTMKWKGPFVRRAIRWMNMPHFMHMLQLAPDGGWSQYEVYTLDGWETLISSFPTEVPKGAELLILRGLGMRDRDCPGIHRLVRRFHQTVSLKSGVKIPPPRHYRRRSNSDCDTNDSDSRSKHSSGSSKDGDFA
jgi:hypothetical protein